MGSVTVGSYNIHWGRWHRGPRRWERFDVVDACRQVDTDVLALQEVWRPDGGPSVAQEVAETLGYDLHEVWTARVVTEPTCRLVGRTGDSAGTGDLGQALLTRVPRGPVSDNRLSGFLLDHTDRTVLKTEIDVGGVNMTVCASHSPHLEHISPLLCWRLKRVLPTANTPAVLMGAFDIWSRWTGFS